MGKNEIEGSEEPECTAPDDRKCPKCGNYLSYDDGAYYCDTEGYDGHENRCEFFLRRWPCP
jgi:hypothetical protein